jgi:indole-3-glycerol phosphate synthase
MDKLTEIMAWKRQEIAPRIRKILSGEFEALAEAAEGRPTFREALDIPGRLAVIAEMKRRSPSAGVISESTAADVQAARYAHARADAISVLTDEKFFGGSLDDLRRVTNRFAAERIRVPCLRKDFMIHPIQVIEAVTAGASAILIIVRALTDDEIADLFEAATIAGLDTLFEVHNEAEVERAVGAGASIVGVNNRDLAVFKTDLALSEKLIPLIPHDVIAVSESGINTKEDAARAKAAGARAILVGEALMRAPDPAALIAEFHAV